MCCFPSTPTLSPALPPLLPASFFLFCFIAVRTLWLNLSARCLSSFTGRFNHPTPSDSTPSSRLWCIYPRSVRPFHSYLGCPHCALRCCITPVSMPGHWGSTPCCCQSWTNGRYPDLAIAVTPIDQTQAPRQYEARARVSVFVEWYLRAIRPLADLGPPRQGQARGKLIYVLCIKR